MQNVITQIGNFSYYNNKVIGQGATGLVYSGFRNQDKLPVAVKAIKLQDINTPVKKHLLDCEVLALKTLKHKFICQTYDVLKDNQFYYVPMQIFPNGTLRDYIKSKGKLPQFEALQMFSKIVEGYCAIRQAGFMHRDIKTENILLRSNMEPGIIDFGYCQKIETSNKSLTYNVGSPAYMSPEAYNDSVYSQKSDVWALGVVLHEMVTGTIPHMRTSDVDEYFRYLKNMKNAEIVAAGQSEACNRILLSALAVDSRVRCSSNQLLNMVTGALPQNSPMKKNNQNYEIFSPVLQRSNSMTKANQNLQFNRTPVRQVQQNLQNNKGWKFVPQQQINLVDLRQSDKISTKSNYSGSSQQQSPVLRQTIGNTVAQNISPQFAGLRKRIQSNVNFNLNLTPVRTNQQNTYTENNPYQYRQSPMNMNMNSPMSGNLLQKQRSYNNEPMTAMLPERQINYQNSPYGPRMKKSNSYGNLGVQLVHRF